MKKLVFTLCMIFLVCSFTAQDLYFPPLEGDDWESTSPEELGWCQDEIDSLIQFLDEENTRAFLVLKDGKIVIEQYFENHSMNTWWYWASAGKSLTAFLTGLAQEQGYLNINDPTSQYLGSGWTNCTPEQEDEITIWHQLTMTSGLDDTSGDADCTNDTCLNFLAEPGTRWAYHNAPYTLLENVVSNATGVTYNNWTNTEIEEKTGMVGAWLQLGFNNVYWSSARSMSRFGLLMLNDGIWENDTVMHDIDYLNSMIVPSQNLNSAYGYLWWLNAGPDYMIPGLQFVFNGNITPNAPTEMYAAAGKNGQLLNIVPSENLIVVRMGDNPNNSLVPITFQNDMWSLLNEVMCTPTALEQHEKVEYVIYPNPADDIIRIQGINNMDNLRIELIDIKGKVLNSIHGRCDLDISQLDPGTYLLRIIHKDRVGTRKFIKY